jgi:tRNA 2-selenouridine synthase SelU
MTPIMPDRMTWASTIGLFILNFGTLDLQVQDYLENHLSAEEFADCRERPFAERVERIQKIVQQPEYAAEKRKRFEQWASRLEPIRKIRNLIAHGLLRITRSEDNKTWRMTVSLPRDLYRSDSPGALHLNFEELFKASQDLTALMEDFKAWTGGWATDATISI